MKTSGAESVDQFDIRAYLIYRQLKIPLFFALLAFALIGQSFASKRADCIRDRGDVSAPFVDASGVEDTRLCCSPDIALFHSACLPVAN